MTVSLSLENSPIIPKETKLKEVYLSYFRIRSTPLSIGGIPDFSGNSGDFPEFNENMILEACSKWVKTFFVNRNDN
jgi:hypothetical protein